MEDTIGAAAVVAAVLFGPYFHWKTTTIHDVE
jgi:hypothetical protein